MLFHKYLVSNEYCKLKKPKLNKIISKNKVLFMYEINSYNIYNLNWLYEMFYWNNKKIITENLKDYLTPLSLTIWYLDSIYKLPKSALYSFDIKKENIKYISEILKDKYNIDTIIKLENKDKVAFYIKNSSNNAFSGVVKPYILPSLQYKLKSQHNKLTLWNQSNFNYNLFNSLNYRNYSTGVKDQKYTAKYKKEYELSIIQKEALIGIISKTLIPSRLYSTSVKDTLFNNNKLSKLDGYFIAGFTDGEGCFRVRISKSNERKTGWMVEPIFQIGLHKKDLVILQLIQKAWDGIGSISSMGKEGVMFKVSSIKNLNEIIIPYFMKYSLLTSKQVDFELLKKVVDIINRKEHLTIEGIRKIVAIRASMNLGLSNELQVAFPDVKPVPRPSTNENKIEDPNWLAGFINGEGSFFIDVYKSKTNKIGSAVRLKFLISQHKRDINIMKSLPDYLGCGQYVLASSDYKHGEYIISKLSDINEKIIPFLTKYPIIGNKSLDFEDFCKASVILKNKEHLTLEGLKKIKTLKSGMNRGRICE